MAHDLNTYFYFYLRLLLFARLRNETDYSWKEEDTCILDPSESDYLRNKSQSYLLISFFFFLPPLSLSLSLSPEMERISRTIGDLMFAFTKRVSPPKESPLFFLARV